MRRGAAHPLQDRTDFIDMAQMIAFEFAQPVAKPGFVKPIDRGLIGVGGVVIELDQIFQEIF